MNNHSTNSFVKQNFYDLVIRITIDQVLTQIRVGFLEVCFAVGEAKITPCLELIRIMLEAWNLVLSAKTA